MNISAISIIDIQIITFIKCSSDIIFDNTFYQYIDTLTNIQTITNDKNGLLIIFMFILGM